MVEVTTGGTYGSSYFGGKQSGGGSSIEEPTDLILMSLKEKVYVKCRFGRELRGKLVVRGLLSSMILIG
jgi:hypothetical protein